MLLRELIVVYCVNDTEQKYTNPVLTSQGTHYVSATKTSRLALFRETVAVYCENHIHCVGKMLNSLTLKWLIGTCMW
jgi:hypothetical protein